MTATNKKPNRLTQIRYLLRKQVQKHAVAAIDSTVQECQQIYKYPGISLMVWKWLMQFQLLHTHSIMGIGGVDKEKGSASGKDIKSKIFQKSQAEVHFHPISNNFVTQPSLASRNLF